MKMKHITRIGLVLVTALVVGCFAACSAPVKTETQDTGKKTTEESASAVTSSGKGEFQSFKGKDLDGNDIDESILKNNKVTVLNFWFNGCSACVSEMPELEKFNQKLKEKGAELIGVNVEAPSGENAVKEAKDILSKQGATYRNIMITEGDKAVGYMRDIMAFPTTVLVDQNGNIIGEPICGAINSEEMMNDILNKVEKAMANE